VALHAYLLTQFACGMARQENRSTNTLGYKLFAGVVMPEGLEIALPRGAR